MRGWSPSLLGDFIKVKHGFAFSGEYITARITKYILVTPGNFSIGGGFKGDKFKYFDGEIPNDYILKADDLVITMTDLSKEGDTLGYSALIPNSSNVFLHNQRIGLVKDVSPGLDKNFLYWLLRTQEYREYILGSATGTSVQHTSPATILKYIFLLPSLPEQKAIAAVLSSFDDKIDLLHRQNATLEAMAEALFRQWFVVEAKEEWEELSVGDIAEQVKLSISPKAMPKELFTHYSLPAYDAGKIPGKAIGASILSNKFKIEENSILVSKLNPMFPRIWLLFDSLGANAISSTEFISVKQKRNGMLCFLYCLLKSKHVTEEFARAASGTSGSHQRITPKDIFSISFYAPSNDYLVAFANNVLPHFMKIKFNQTQICTLEKLRDTLLPKLMAGEVRVI